MRIEYFKDDPGLLLVQRGTTPVELVQNDWTNDQVTWKLIDEFTWTANGLDQKTDCVIEVDDFETSDNVRHDTHILAKIVIGAYRSDEHGWLDFYESSERSLLVLRNEGSTSRDQKHVLSGLFSHSIYTYQGMPYRVQMFTKTSAIDPTAPAGQLDDQLTATSVYRRFQLTPMPDFVLDEII